MDRMATKTTQAAPKLVNYIRVSTKRQGESGLGLDGQIKAVNDYAASVNGQIVATYREVESGKNNARPELAKAIAHAKRIRARLVIAKLDRLARNVHFVSGLMESNVDFICCDNQHANRLTIHILAAVAEDEARRISERTKAALQAAKARGMLLGSARPGHWSGRDGVRLAAAAKARKAAKELRDREAAPIYNEVRPIITRMKTEGASLQAIAGKLNSDGFTTLRGANWNRMQVSRLVASAEKS
jgi:DNA invertase Pin-like site-specific DNA recombinase